VAGRALKACGAGAVLIAGLAPPAHAHLVGVEFGDANAGALHVLSAPEHLAALLALALLAAFTPRTDARWTLLALPLGLAGGVALAAASAFDPAIDPAIAATLVVAGLAGLLARPLPAALIAALAVFTGLVHGFANGLPARGMGIDWLLYGTGVVAAGFAVTLLASAAIATFGDWQDWTRLAARVVSSWLAAAGLLYLAVALWL